MNSERWLSPLISDHKRVGGDMIVFIEIIVGRLMRDTFRGQGCQVVTINVRKEQEPTCWGYRLPPRRSRSTFSKRNQTKRCRIPINFFNKRRDVGKRKEITMFRKSSIEDIVKFCLSLLLDLGIADHRQKESSDCRSCGICSRWSIASSTKRRREEDVKWADWPKYAKAATSFKMLMSCLKVSEYWISSSTSVTNEGS